MFFGERVEKKLCQLSLALLDAESMKPG